MWFLSLKHLTAPAVSRLGLAVCAKRSPCGHQGIEISWKQRDKWPMRNLSKCCWKFYNLEILKCCQTTFCKLLLWIWFWGIFSSKYLQFPCGILCGSRWASGSMWYSTRRWNWFQPTVLDGKFRYSSRMSPVILFYIHNVEKEWWFMLTSFFKLLMRGIKSSLTNCSSSAWVWELSWKWQVLLKVLILCTASTVYIVIIHVCRAFRASEKSWRWWRFPSRNIGSSTG